MIIGKQQFSVDDYIDDYTQFGIYNGLYAINAYLVFWDLISEKSRKIRMAKIIAEYGRAIEEMFAHVYAMAGQSISKKLVFWERLIHYSPKDLTSFIKNTDYADLASLLHLSDHWRLAKHFDCHSEYISNVLAEASQLLVDIRHEYIQQADGTGGNLKKVYNKLKHPCLLIYQAPEFVSTQPCFGIMMQAEDRNESVFDCQPVEVSFAEALKYHNNVLQVTYNLMFLLKAYRFSSSVRNGGL